MSRLIPALLLAALSFSSVSCKKNRDDDPTPAALPAPVYEMYSLVSYPASNETTGTRYAAPELKGEARQENGRITLNFNSGINAKSLVQFVMPDGFAPSKLGSFVHQSLPAPAANAVQATYTLTYNSAPATLRIMTHRAYQHLTEGSVVITAYDEVHRLISGTYELSFKDVPDPYAEKYPNERKSVIMVGGKFSNLPIVP